MLLVLLSGFYLASMVLKCPALATGNARFGPISETAGSSGPEGQGRSPRL